MKRIEQRHFDALAHPGFAQYRDEFAELPSLIRKLQAEHIYQADCLRTALRVLEGGNQIEALTTLRRAVANDTPIKSFCPYCELVVADPCSTPLEEFRQAEAMKSSSRCSDCPPSNYPTDETRCTPCPLREGAAI